LVSQKEGEKPLVSQKEREKPLVIQKEREKPSVSQSGQGWLLSVREGEKSPWSVRQEGQENPDFGFYRNFLLFLSGRMV